MCESILAISIPPGQTSGISCTMSPMGGHLADNSVPAPRVFANNKILVLQHPIVISDGTQSQGFQAVKHCHFGVGEEHKLPIRAIKPFALSFCCRSDSFRDLFYAVLLN